MELKRIDFDGKMIEGTSGRKYYIESELSIDRFTEFEKLQSHVGFGVDFDGIVNKLNDAYDKLNKSKPMDAGIIIHNLLNGIIMRMENRNHPVLEMCALFINEENEDRVKYSLDAINKKIDDWKEYDINDFFQLAFNLVKNFIPIYEEISLSISAEKAKLKDKKKKSITVKPL